MPQRIEESVADESAQASMARLARGGDPAAFAALYESLGAAVHGWLGFFETYDIEKYGMEGGPLHDPCVIAYLLQPELFSGRHVAVQIETVSELTMGMTVVDWWGITDLAPSAMVMNQIDADGFFDLLVERIGRLP